MPYSSLIRERRIGFIAEVFRNVQIGPDTAMGEGELVQDLPQTNRESARQLLFRCGRRVDVFADLGNFAGRKTTQFRVAMDQRLILG